MQSKRRSVKNSTAAAIASVVVVAFSVGTLAGCSGHPPAGSPAYEEGELGNGDFLFVCDDGVACLPYAGAAKNFPNAIATGSTFDIRFVGKGQQGPVVIINEKRYEGLTSVGLPPFIGAAAEGGFAALEPGYGTIMVRDSGGTVIDYVTLKIVKPNDLVIYDASYDSSRGKGDITRLQKLNLSVDEKSSYRVVAEYNNDPIAGSIPVKWTSDNPEIVEIESYSRRVVNVRAKQLGTATITADGAGLKKSIEVEVKP